MVVRDVRGWAALGMCCVGAAAGCGFDSELAARVEVPVVVQSDGMGELVNAEGYAIRVTTMRVAFENVEFTTSGEMHASLWSPVLDLVVPTAYAHPGHYAGGEVVGEMNGRFVVDWLDAGAELGLATLLEARYDGANFVFTRARPGDGIADEDPLMGHTFEIAGEATRDGRTWTFSALVDQDEGRRVIGLPFDLEVDEGADDVLGLQMLLFDPSEADTVFDGIDFAALDPDDDGVVELVPDSEAYNVLKKQLQVHDHWAVTTE